MKLLEDQRVVNPSTPEKLVYCDYPAAVEIKNDIFLIGCMKTTAGWFMTGRHDKRISADLSNKIWGEWG